MANKDWTGNGNSIYKTLGASNHTDKEREANDFYATSPEAIDKLLEVENLYDDIWEPAAGEGHLVKRLREKGYSVFSSDIIQRDYPLDDVLDFLNIKTSCYKLSYDIVTNPPYKCFSADTECYTREGWKYIKDVKINDEILSINPKDLNLEWTEIEDVIKYKVNEELFHFKKSHLDILCTKDHRMFAFDKNGLVERNGDLILSQDIRGTHYIPREGYKWKGQYISFFVLPAINGKKYAQSFYKKEIKIDIVKWIRFLGLWLADGYCRHTKNSQGNLRKTVGIKQNCNNAELVRNVLRDLPFAYKEYIDKNRKSPCYNFEIHNEQLWEYLKQYGKSDEKFVPTLIKNLPPKYLKIFLDSYFSGDGSEFLRGSVSGRIYRSISKKLIEDIQEIILKLGFLAHITQSTYKTSKGELKTLYVINYSPTSKYNKIFYTSAKKSKEHYEGDVVCLTLKKNGVFLCRRNGKEFVSGNCAKEFVLKALDLIEQGRKVCMFLKLTFLEGKSRYKELFSKYPPKTVYVFSERIMCAKNGDFEGMKAGGGSAVAYAWFVWEKGFTGDTIVKWI